MDFDYDTLVAFSKSWGLLYLFAFFLAVVLYAFWPSNKNRFDRAKKSIIDQDDKPWK